MTRYERIKNMTIEEMVTYLNRMENCEFCVYEDICENHDCDDGIKKFLEIEVE